MTVQYYGIEALVRLCSHFAFIYLAFWGLNAVRLDTFFKPLHTPQIRTILLLAAIAIGYSASSFFVEVLQLCKNIFLTFR